MFTLFSQILNTCKTESNFKNKLVEEGSVKSELHFFLSFDLLKYKKTPSVEPTLHSTNKNMHGAVCLLQGRAVPVSVAGRY